MRSHSLTVAASRWRWRESNPRPLSLHQDFSGRSVRCLYSAPPVIHTSRCDGPSRCELSRPPPRPGRTVSHLADASIRAGDEPGLTDPLCYLGSESEIGAICIGAYFLCVACLTRAATRTSARFSCIDVQSRNRSPPFGGALLSLPAAALSTPPADGEQIPAAQPASKRAALCQQTARSQSSPRPNRSRAASCSA